MKARRLLWIGGWPYFPLAAGGLALAGSSITVSPLVAGFLASLESARVWQLAPRFFVLRNLLLGEVDAVIDSSEPAVWPRGRMARANAEAEPVAA